jgi:6-phosphogluconolactonase (cycloisomerase 2 family)
MRFRDGMSVLLLLCTSLALYGCPSGESRDIPPGPTTSPPPLSKVFVYVALARDPDPDVGTNGGSVVVYELGEDGLLPGGPPNASVPVVNPRRLVRHPELDVLYVASSSQIFAFDISGGGLVSLCGPDGGLGPPCATDPRAGSNPVDMTFLRNAEGEYLLYVVEQGGGQNLDTPTRLAAYELGSDGALPGLASSQAVTLDAITYQGAAVTPGFAYVGDVGLSQIVRFPLQADGNLPDIPPTPSPFVPTPVPTLTPVGATPTPTATPSPAPTAYRAFAPGKIIQAAGEPVPGEFITVLYVVQQSRRRIGANPVDAFGDLGEDPSSESNTRGLYNVIVVDRFASPTRIYGAAFQNGQVDSFAIQPDGNIIDDTLSATFANTASYPTGLSLLDFAPQGSAQTRTIFVSLGGFDRVDAYAVNADGTLAERPFSSTEAITGTFPSDVLAYVSAP